MRPQRCPYLMPCAQPFPAATAYPMTTGNSRDITFPERVIRRPSVTALQFDLGAEVGPEKRIVDPL